MSVEIDPLELGFRRPFTTEIGQTLRIKNSNSSPVAFKVKTTAPKQYCVRPNSGRIEPGHEVEVSILLQAMRQPPAPDAKCRDKFLVQSVIITPDKEFTNVQNIWEDVAKSAIQEKKIRVNWLPPAGEEPSQPATTTTPRKPAAEPSNAFTSTPREAGAELPQPVTAPRRPIREGSDAIFDNSSSPQADTTVLEDATALSRAERNEAESPQANQSYPPPPPYAPSTVKTVAAETYDELKEKLARAEATIASLQGELSGGLRQRKTAGPSSEGNGGAAGGAGQLQTNQQPPVTEGVPVRIAAILCLVSFLLAYFLF